jgi:hypothetical protein
VDGEQRAESLEQRVQQARHVDAGHDGHQRRPMAPRSGIDDAYAVSRGELRDGALGRPRLAASSQRSARRPIQRGTRRR